jgi:hypothetical protein
MAFLPGLLISLRPQIELIYALIIVVVSGIIYLYLNRINRLANHKGIGYFMKAFLFYGMAFFMRFMIYSTKEMIPKNYSILLFLGVLAYEYFLCAAGFYLAYSMVYKNFSENRMIFLHGVAVIIAVLDIKFFHMFLYASQFAVLAYAILLSYGNYMQAKKSGKNRIESIYFTALVLILLAYIINMAEELLRSSLPYFYIYAYLLTLLGMFLILLSIFKINSVKKNGKEA